MLVINRFPGQAVLILPPDQMMSSMVKVLEVKTFNGKPSVSLGFYCPRSHEVQRHELVLNGDYDERLKQKIEFSYRREED